MFSEFQVRAEISRIEALDVRPMRKARLLLKIARIVEKAAGRLSLLSQYHYKVSNPLVGARFREAAQRLVEVDEEVRLRARDALAQVPKRLGYGYASRGDAYPIWSAYEAAPHSEARL